MSEVENPPPAKEETEVAPDSEEPQAYFEPVVKLDEVEVTTGEEEEEVIFKQCVLLVVCDVIVGLL